jgi:hypothetical protein
VKTKAFFKPALKTAALVCVLLAAEAFAVVHPLDLDAHSTGEPCKICISVASFGSATVAALAGFVIDASSPQLDSVPFIVTTRSRPTSHFARGPPRAS